MSVRLAALWAAASILLAPAVGQAPAAAAEEPGVQTVSFGIPRTGIGPGLEYEAACRVDARVEEVVIPEGDSQRSSIDLRPGPCEVVIFTSGVPVPIPLLNATPLGPHTLVIPSITGFNLSLATLRVDVTTTLVANYSGTSPSLSAFPRTLHWTTWGAAPLNLTANVGNLRGDLALEAPFTLAMHLALAVRVAALGVEVLNFEIPYVGRILGSPGIAIPVTIKPGSSFIGPWLGGGPLVLLLAAGGMAGTGVLGYLLGRRRH